MHSSTYKQAKFRSISKNSYAEKLFKSTFLYIGNKTELPVLATNKKWPKATTHHLSLSNIFSLKKKSYFPCNFKKYIFPWGTEEMWFHENY